ncbi:DUF4105 domain-containing protein [Pseudoalteromonas holothuriae]|uniref:Lnb N-terminal periplasmic domain-containing protein n=1 Tax=Pseudoalteromonas holothuriae TaxID=2963714 RepID=UPI0021BE5634|nr:DUF4105 domain-containing protein [Pseudoalteromonas sp. CIP111951]
MSIFNALVHKKGANQAVQDSGFFFFTGSNVLEVELRKSVEIMLGASQIRADFICEFPARALWISKRFQNTDTVDFSHCEALEYYLKAVDTNSISIVYASENLVSPSSFMGHSFLKLNSGQGREHAVSYFTDVDTINIPKLLFDSIVTGKQGHFVVSPYLESKRFYGQVEARNIYEYHLNLSDFEVKLLTLHLWELKERRIDYYFHSHNCATITLDILGIIEPNIIQSHTAWLTPLDVVKIVNNSQFVSHSTITPSLNWQLRTYGLQLSNMQKKTYFQQLIKGNLQKLEHTKKDELFVSRYLAALNRYLLKELKISKIVWQKNQAYIDDSFYENKGLEIDVGSFKNPLNRLGDSQASFSFHANSTQSYLLVNAIPASHLVSDDNRHAFSESSLELISPTVIITKDEVKLDEFTLYGISQYIPYDPIIGGVSGYFSLAYSGFDSSRFTTESKALAVGGLGVSMQPMPAFQYYGTIGTAVVTDIKRAWFETKLEAGLIAYLKGNNKLNLSAMWRFNKNNLHQSNMEIEFQNTYSIDAVQAILFGAKYTNWSQAKSKVSLFTGYKIYF